jgi:hypothetical protein
VGARRRYGVELEALNFFAFISARLGSGFLLTALYLFV